MTVHHARIAVLANPTAGRGRTAKHIDAVVQRLSRHGLDTVVLRADSAATSQVLAAQAVDEDVDALVAVGGDGTVHIALQAVAGTDIPLGIVPVGTGNDLAGALGIPSDVDAAVDAIAAQLLTGTYQRVDAVRTTTATGEQMWWGAILSAGFDSDVNQRANRMRWPRGPRRYDLAIMVEVARLRIREFSLRFDDDQTWDGRALLVAIGNTSTYGGGMRMCPAADPTDGLLDTTIIGPVSRTELIRVKPRLYDGGHVEHRQVTTIRSRTVSIDAAGVHAYADGEPLAALPLTVTCEPGALTILAPALIQPNAEPGEVNGSAR